MTLCTLCQKDPVHYINSKLCRNCYQWIYDKQKRSPTSMMSYLNKVDLAYARSSQYRGGRKKKR